MTLVHRPRPSFAWGEGGVWVNTAMVLWAFGFWLQSLESSVMHIKPLVLSGISTWLMLKSIVLWLNGFSRPISLGRILPNVVLAVQDILVTSECTMTQLSM